MVNSPLAHAILDSGKKKKTIARLARMEPYELSRVLCGMKTPTDKQRERLAAILQKPASELFPESQPTQVAL